MVDIISVTLAITQSTLGKGSSPVNDVSEMALRQDNLQRAGSYNCNALDKTNGLA